jgi:molybdate transport system substrate-binding protein
VGAVVARGKADIGFQQISELMPMPGIAQVTPLPSEAQKVSMFSAGIGKGTTDPSLAQAVLISFLASPAATGAIARSGLEPIGSIHKGEVSSPLWDHRLLPSSFLSAWRGAGNNIAI